MAILPFGSPGILKIGKTVVSGTAGSVLYVNSSGQLAQDTTAQANFYWDGSNHRFALGHTSPSVLFHLATTNTASYVSAGGTTTLGAALLDLVTTDTSTTFMRTMTAQITGNLGSNPAANKAVIGLAGEAVIPSGNSTTLTNVSLRGLNASATHSGTGTLKDGFGGQYSVANSATGTITNATVFRAVLTNSNASGTMTTAKGFDVANLSNSGTITDTYGYYCGDVTAGTQTNGAWSFYGSDTGANNYFGGKVLIGTAGTPSSLLHIEGATSGWIIQDEQDSNPTTTELDSLDSVAIYSKANKFVIAYNNAGTVTYITIPLDGSTTTWTHGVGAP